ncbi:hypothetical protein HYT92_02125 [Candidatus Pacearchaeota archaeon]|nr:hypothetical protein [Candidatus Pacearchaeota archaeon]
MVAETNMTIDNAEYGQNRLEDETKSEKKDVFYRGARLLGGLVMNSGVFFCYTPRAMLDCFSHYERLLKQARYKEAREFETGNNLPCEWLNLAISGVARESESGLAEKLIDEFKDRGYSKVWLKNRKIDL